MNARTLVVARLRAWFRRGSGGGALTSLGITAVGLAAIAASVWLAQGWAVEASGDVKRVRDHLFWLAVLQALVFAYTTFEVAFRADDRRFVGLLPVPGQTRWLDLSIRNLVVHVPLVAPGLGYAWGLAGSGSADLALYAVGLLLGTFALGVPLCGWLHLKAGLSLLAPPGAGRKMLAGATVPAEAALLLYTPALGLAGTLTGVLVMDGVLRRALMDPDTSVATTASSVLGAAAVIGGVLIIRAAQEASGTLHRVVARFSEVDVPGPYREDGLPERCPGIGWSRLLSSESRPFFERDLKQLRRRYRLDRILIWLTGLWALRLGWVSTDLAETHRELWLLGGLATVLACHGPLATEGRELGSRWLRAALPNRLLPRVVGSGSAFLAAAIWIWIWAGVAMGWAGGVEAGLVLTGLGLGTCAVVWGSALVIARTANAERLRGYATVWTVVSVITVSYVAERFG